MTTQVISKLEELNPYIQELASLSSLERPTRQQHTRVTALMSIISALKAGESAATVRAWEVDELRKAAGLSKLPDAPRTRLGQDTEAAWRKWAASGECRSTYIPNPREVRANEAGTETVSFTQPTPGGYFVPPGMHGRFFETMKQHDQIFEDWASNQIETDTGAIMQIPSADDVSNQSVQVGESVQSNEVDIFNFGQVQLNAYSFRTKIVAMSLELIQDSNFAVGTVLERIFSIRHSLGVGNSLLRGSGTASPTGLLTATVGSGAVPVIAAGSSANTGGSETGAVSIGSSDLVNLYKKLDPKLRPGAVWYMADATLRYFAGLLDKSGRPLFQDGLLGDDSQPHLMGKKVAITPSMPALGSGNNSVVFAQPAYFTVRTVPSSTYIRRYWQNPTLVNFGLIGFESFFRVDSNLVAPNVNFLPSQYLQNHS
jgi:HK97 family phage major capsid protein